MAKTRYPDTNNQFAFKTDRASFLAGIASRAETLWSDGYRVTPQEGTTFHIGQEGKDGGYFVDPVAHTCGCKFCADQKEFPLTLDGSLVACKHLLGLKDLVQEEAAYWKRLRDTAAAHGDANSQLRAAEYDALYSALYNAWRRVKAERTLLAA